MGKLNVGAANYLDGLDNVIGIFLEPLLQVVIQKDLSLFVKVESYPMKLSKLLTL